MNEATIALTMTHAGLQAFTAAQVDGAADLVVSHIGLTDEPFVTAPTLTALPGQFKTLATISGLAVGDNIVHLMIRDDSTDAYGACGLGLFLADGTLFAVYGQANDLFTKSSLSTFLTAIDIVFPTPAIDALTFGDTNFLNPPATTQTPGVIALATPAQTVSGTDTQHAITPADLSALLPPGAIMLWFGSSAAAPIGWAICDGSTVARSDGSGQITTPDLRDRVAVGAGGAYPLGAVIGAGMAATTAVGTHHHAVAIDSAVSATGLTLTAPTDNGTAQGGTGTRVTSVAENDPGHNHHVAGNTGEAGDHNHEVDVHQPSMALYFIMRV